MRSIFCIVILTAAFVSCAPSGDRGPAGPQGDPGVNAPVPVTPTIDEVDADIAALTLDENDYRLGLGQTMLSPGLTCSVQQVASGQWLSSSSPGYTSGVIVTTGTNYPYLYRGAFNQPDANTGGSNLIPPNIRDIFVGLNYKITCSGFIVVMETNYYIFDMTSDDGSILTVDGTQVINNDNNHGMLQKLGTKFLRRGVRSFSISYAQTGGGNFGLILKANGSTLDPRIYLH